MAMDESQRIRLLQQQANTYVSRSRPRDSSEITYMLQAKAAQAFVAPTLRAGAPNGSFPVVTGCNTSGQFVTQGKATNKDYTALIQGLAGCAVCSDPVPSEALGIYIPVVSNDYLAPPFTQQNLSTPYVVCQTPNNNYFFPPPASGLSNCSNSQQRLFFPS
jgi:hypothetical protein